MLFRFRYNAHKSAVTHNIPISDNNLCCYPLDNIYT